MPHTVKVSQRFYELIKWMFAFWIGQAGLTVGLVLLVIGRS